MKLENLYNCKDLTDFQIRCLTNKSYGPNPDSHGAETYAKLWEQAKTVGEFKKLVRNCKEVRMMQGTVELLKDDEDFVKECLSDVGLRVRTTSDAGSVKIGNDSFSILVPNGSGDGETTIIITEHQRAFNSDLLQFFTSVEGTIDIYNYDCGGCGGEVIKTIEGRYGIFYGHQFVVFEKWD